MPSRLPSVKKRFLNHSEEVTYDKLRAVCEPLGAHVFAKPRIKDVLPVDGSGVSDREFGFCLKSHFDFVVTDSDHIPEFSVEFDGPAHGNDSRQMERDELKNRLCDKFEHPLLRINSRYLDKKYRGYDLLTYFVDVWYHEKVFHEAQEKGLVPMDEPFAPTLLLHDGSSNGKVWPLNLSYDHERKIKNWFDEGKVAQPGPSHCVGKDSNGTYHCLAWILLPNKNILFVKTGMRQQRFPVSPSEVLGMLSVFDLHQSLQDYFRGSSRPKSLQHLSEQLAHFKTKFVNCSSSTWSVGSR
jgi:hypothetical protein